MPRISVVVPTYHGVETLADTLESLRRQTAPPLEVIVVDDGSSDETADLAQAHGVGARVIRLETNHGVAFARNVGLREASGDLVAFIDQDDMWLPQRLARIAEALDDHPQWRALVTDEQVFAADEDKAALTAMEHPFLPWVQHWRPRGQVLSLLDDVALPRGVPGPSPVPASRIMAGSISKTTSYVLDRELAIACGGFAGWLRSADDWILLQTLSQYADVGRLPDASVLYRVHPHNTSVTTDWPMPLLVAAAAVRLGGRVVARGAERDPEVVQRLSASPFLQHVLDALARAHGWRARADAVAAWQLLATDRDDRRATRGPLLRAVASGATPSWLRSATRRLRRLPR